MLKVLVCVTRQVSCERLIQEGADLVAERGGELSVVHVAPTGEKFMRSDSEGDALEYLYSVSKRYGAEMTLLRADNVMRELSRHARKKQATHMILGVPGDFAGIGVDLARELGHRLPGVQVLPVTT